MATNDTGDVSDSILWETFKMVMVGHIIADESRRRKERKKLLVEIEAQLPALEHTYRASALYSDLNNILTLKYEYNTILGNQVSSLMLKLKIILKWVISPPSF